MLFCANPGLKLFFLRNGLGAAMKLWRAIQSIMILNVVPVVAVSIKR